jgi:HEAT repeat protein
MFNWLKKATSGTVVSGGGVPPASSSYPERELAWLAEDFQHLDAIAKYSPRILQFLRDGSDRAVVDELARAGIKTAHLMGWSKPGAYSYNTLGRDHHSRQRFFKNTTIDDPAFFCRLATVYSAIAAVEMVPWKLTLGGDGLDPFLLAAGNAECRPYYGEIVFIGSSFRADIVEKMFELTGQPKEKLARFAFFSDVEDFHLRPLLVSALALGGFGDYAQKYPAVITEAITHPELKVRVHALNVMLEKRIDPAPFLDRLADMAVGSSKQVRERAEMLLNRAGSAAPALIEKLLVEGDAEQRMYSAQAVSRMKLGEARPILEAALQKETARRVRDAIESLLQASAPKPPAAPVVEIATPAAELPPITLDDPELPDSVRSRIEELVANALNAHLAYFEENKATQRWLQKPVHIGHDYVSRLFSVIQRGKNSLVDKPPHWFNIAAGSVESVLRQILRLPEMRLTHAVRLLHVTEQINPDRSGRFAQMITPIAAEALTLFRNTHKRTYTARELAAAFHQAGIDPMIIGRTILQSYVVNAAGDEWVGDGIHEYFAERPALIDDVFSIKQTADSDYEKQMQRRSALDVLCGFPTVPPTLADRVWEIALSGNRVERPLAQNALDQDADKLQRLHAALKDPRAEARAIAAEWLSRIADPSSTEPVRAALQKEKSEAARGAYMLALERLGVALEEFLDRPGLAAEAAKGLKNGPPEALKWFGFTTLPHVRWRDTSESIDPKIVQWFVVQAFKAKNPEPSPLLRQYTSYFVESDRDALGQYVLESWIAQDTAPRYTPEEADRLSQQQAAQYWTSYQKYYAQSGKTQQDLQRELYNGLLNQCLGSAIKEKGMLAIAGACCGANAVPLIGRYLKTWYGMRAAQCKALISMLAWIDDPAAIQLLLSTANRFRTRSIREAADAYVHAIAERKGWTLDELSDRTIPGIGFEDKPEMTIDYGTRKFTVRLGRNFDFIIENEDGKTIKSLPDARQEEDAELVKEAKKTFADAKKQIKPMLALQKERLYEAMCTQRVWRFGDWDTYLNHHPIVSRYCQALVWEVIENDRVTGTFRALEDGTLTDAHDNEVKLDENARIRLAHACTLPAAEVDPWKKHFADYEVEPLFEQFRSEQFQPPKDEGATEIGDFEGHVLEAFKLRGKATKLGYIRGDTGDGGYFTEYKKVYAGLGLEAMVEFSGNSLPEENRTVALMKIYFARTTKQNSWGMAAKIPIRKVPAVLVSETWNDVKVMASQGGGFDPQWKKKTGW